MAVKTFTTGSVLTYSDTNTYLANSGLVYVKSQTVGSNVPSVTITSAFNSTYDNYKIVYTGGTCAASTSIAITLGASGVGYYGALIYSSASPASATAAGHANTGSFAYVGYAEATSTVTLDFDLLNPNLAQWTSLANGAWLPAATFGTYHGTHQVATAYTDFTIAAGGNLTGGVVTVYGYRKA